MKVKYNPVLEYCLTYQPHFKSLSGKENPCLFELYGLALLDYIKEPPEVKSYFRVISKGGIPDYCLIECSTSCQHLDSDLDIDNDVSSVKLGKCQSTESFLEIEGPNVNPSCGPSSSIRYYPCGPSKFHPCGPSRASTEPPESQNELPESRTELSESLNELFEANNDCK